MTRDYKIQHFLLAPSVGGVAKGADKEGDVVVLLGLFHAEHDGHLRVKAAGPRRLEVGLGVERHAVGGLAQLLKDANRERRSMAIRPHTMWCWF